MGVVTVSDIDYGQIFGPFPTHITAANPAYILGILTSDKLQETDVLKVNTEELRDGPGCLDWLPYVSPARDEAEQNMEAYLKERGIYFRTLRIVRAGEELLVWYSKDFTHLLGMPELATNSKRDDEQYICPHCGEMFEYPFPLRAHLKFKCAFTADIKTYNLNESLLLKVSSKCISTVPTNNNNNNNNNNKRSNEEADDSATPAKLMRSPNKDKTRSSFSSKYSIEELCKSSTTEAYSGHKTENGDDDCSDNLTTTASAFRKVERISNGKPERAISPCNDRKSTVQTSSFPTEDRSTTPPSSNGSLPSPTSTSSSSSPFSSLGPLTFPSVHSPIGHGSSPPVSPRQYQPLSPSSSMPPPPRPPIKSNLPSPSSPSSSSHFEDQTLIKSQSLMGIYLPRIPVFPPPSVLGIPRANFFNQAGSSTLSSSPSPSPAVSITPRGIPLQSSNFPSDQIPPGLLEMCRATIPTVGPLTESFAANIRNSESLAKHALFADRHISSLSFLKSSNPMIEKLLQSTNPTLLSSPINALNLSQNWCAKCNATFRMTSDLVYHMRSHHKREFDPMKRKREEKLKCNICNEAFRERHHLTRHMSSHA